MSLKRKRRYIIELPLAEIRYEEREVREATDRRLATYGKVFLLGVIITMGVVYLSKKLSEEKRIA